MQLNVILNFSAGLSLTSSQLKFCLQFLRFRQLADCQSKLLDVITHNIGDSYTQVAECSKCSLRQVRAEVNGVSEILEQRLYDIATRLPRKVSRHGMCLLKVERMFLVDGSLQNSFSVNIFCH